MVHAPIKWQWLQSLFCILPGIWRERTSFKVSFSKAECEEKLGVWATVHHSSDTGRPASVSLFFFFFCILYFLQQLLGLLVVNYYFFFCQIVCCNLEGGWSMSGSEDMGEALGRTVEIKAPQHVLCTSVSICAKVRWQSTWCLGSKCSSVR